MKRLMDEGANDLERSLLEVGSDVRGSERGKAKLLATIAAGSLVGVGAAQTLGASKAWGAWLSSSAGKVGLVTALSVAAGTGGWAVQRQLFHSPSAVEVPSAAPVVAGRQTNGAEVQPGVSAEAVVQAPGPLPEAAPARERAETSAASNGVSQSAGKLRSHSTSDSRSKATPELEQRLLLEETALLEKLRGAVERGDRTTAEKLSRRYWQRFSAGQLNPEASQLDQRLRALPER